MQLNEVPWYLLTINNRVMSSIDNVKGKIEALETIDSFDFITIRWDTDIIMKFNHAWTNDITFIGE